MPPEHRDHLELGSDFLSCLRWHEPGRETVSLWADKFHIVAMGKQGGSGKLPKKLKSDKLSYVKCSLMTQGILLFSAPPLI